MSHLVKNHRNIIVFFINYFFIKISTFIMYILKRIVHYYFDKLMFNIHDIQFLYLSISVSYHVYNQLVKLNVLNYLVKHLFLLFHWNAVQMLNLLNYLVKHLFLLLERFKNAFQMLNVLNYLVKHLFLLLCYNYVQMLNVLNYLVKHLFLLKNLI